MKTLTEETKLSPGEKQALREIMTAYRNRRESLRTKISYYEHRVEVLKTQIEDAIPAIPGAKYVHDRDYNGGSFGVCGMRTAIYAGRTPQGGAAGGDDVYYCVLCEVHF